MTEKESYREIEASYLYNEKGWSRQTIKAYFEKQDLIDEVCVAKDVESLRQVVAKLVNRIHVSGMH